MREARQRWWGEGPHIPGVSLMWFDKSDFVETLDLWSELTMSGSKGDSFPCYVD